MDSRRQLKIASVIKEAFTEILLREGKSIYGQAFVTLTKVKVTSDLTLARFYLSILNAADADVVITAIEHKKHELKRALAEKLRHHLRRIPEIEFFRDETLEYVSHIEDVFHKIKEEDQQLQASLEQPKPVKKRAVRKKP